MGRDKLIKTNTIIHLAKRISDLDFAEIHGNLEKMTPKLANPLILTPEGHFWHFQNKKYSAQKYPKFNYKYL